MQDGPTLKKRARVAGLLYLLSSLFAVLGWVYIPGKLIVSGNATATANAIRGSEWLFRVGMTSELVGAVILVFMVLTLYRLFEGVDQRHASAMLILILLSFPLSFASVSSEMGAMTLYGNPDFLSAFDRHQLDALAMFFLKLHQYGLVVASVFWGLWLFPFGALIIRSGFIPRILGFLLIVAGFGWLMDAFSSVLLSHPGELVSTITTVLEAGELPIIFWLLIFGVKVRPVENTAAAEVGASSRISP